MKKEKRRCCSCRCDMDDSNGGGSNICNGCASRLATGTPLFQVVGTDGSSGTQKANVDLSFQTHTPEYVTVSVEGDPVVYVDVGIPGLGDGQAFVPFGVLAGTYATERDLLETAASGVAGMFYIAEDTGRIFGWDTVNNRWMQIPPEVINGQGSGPTGPTGSQGDIGPQGAQGIAGSYGPPGPAGPAGGAGPAGPQGIPGAQGNPG
ncbi:MAG: hypothetical protein FWF59_10750, partial [Turicibacter sp.]|nr:hypothetical protein [Turicibacter sp.]